MIDYEEAIARYNAVLAELASANALAAEDPEDTELAAAAQELYDQAQVAYADVLAGYGGDGATEPTASSEASDPQSAEDHEAQGDPAAATARAAVADASVVPAESMTAPASAEEYDLGDFGKPATVAAPAFGQEAPEGVFVLTRKPVATRFVPSETPIEELTPISRSILPMREKGQKSALSRERNIAGGLPEWSPIPPGEVLTVKRAGSKKS